ncbi:MAG TPA: hypothetical protein VHX86_17945 [Tepidisphaeraceae bacterium]|nr:hypothetical protein [Tepidisphaeraceae bacterium]
MEGESGHFQCSACGRQFRWKPELAGRDVRCPCGQVLRCPDAPAPQEDMYDLAPEAAKPQHPHPPAAAEPAPANPRVRTLSYQTPRKVIPGAAAGPVDTNTLKNQYIPLWLLGGGTAVELIAAFLLHPHDLPMAMMSISVEVIGGTILMLIGVLVAAKIRGIPIGSFWSAVLRLAAISVAPAAVGDLLMPITRIIPFIGVLLQWGVQFVLYFALLGVLFDLDQSDTWYCVIVIFIINLSVYALLVWLAWHH